MSNVGLGHWRDDGGNEKNLSQVVFDKGINIWAGDAGVFGGNTVVQSSVEARQASVHVCEKAQSDAMSKVGLGHWRDDGGNEKNLSQVVFDEGINIWAGDAGVFGGNTVVQSDAMSTVKLGPWGGDGGNFFDDGPKGVVKLTIHYNSDILTALEVEYENKITEFHGEKGDHQAEIDSTSLDAVDISVTVGNHNAFHPGVGVLAIGFGTSQSLNVFPSGVNGIATHRPRVLGFFGRAGKRVDQLGVYVSNVVPTRVHLDTFVKRRTV